MAGALVMCFARRKGPHVDHLHVEARWPPRSSQNDSTLFFEAAFYKSVQKAVWPLGSLLLGAKAEVSSIDQMFLPSACGPQTRTFQNNGLPRDMRELEV